MEFIIYVVIFLVLCVVGYMVYFVIDEINTKLNVVIRNVDDISELVALNLTNAENVNKNIVDLRELNNEMNNRMLLNVQHVINENIVDFDGECINESDLNINIHQSDETVNMNVTNVPVSYVDMVSPEESLKKNNIVDIDE